MKFVKASIILSILGLAVWALASEKPTCTLTINEFLRSGVAPSYSSPLNTDSITYVWQSEDGTIYQRTIKPAGQPSQDQCYNAKQSRIVP